MYSRRQRNSAVFALDLDVRSATAAPSARVLVGLLQVLLAVLELAGEVLRLFEQALRLLVASIAVQHDSDAVGELFQKPSV